MAHGQIGTVIVLCEDTLVKDAGGRTIVHPTEDEAERWIRTHGKSGLEHTVLRIISNVPPRIAAEHSHL